MESIVFLAVIIGLLLAFFGWETVKEKNQIKQIKKELYENYGREKLREISPERFAKIPGFYKSRVYDAPIDNITWDDLNMDSIFLQMNRTNSCIGEEYLYAMLRDGGKSEENLAHLEEIIHYFDTHPDERVAFQMLMLRLGHMGKYSLYDYLNHLDYLGKPSNVKAYLCNFLFLPIIGMFFVNVPVATFCIVVLAVYNIVSYYKEKGRIEPYIVSFVQIIKLVNCAEEILKLSIPVCEKELLQIKDAKNELKAVKKGAFWVFKGAAGTSGNPLEFLFDYIRMLFHIDIIQFNRMLAHVRGHQTQVDQLVENIGLIESAIAIGAYRISLENGFCLPEFTKEKRIELVQGYHPLIKHPVKNDIATDKPVLLTGSNASGKSTFLRTVALNALLAQTIHTCTAKSYKADMFRICSSMALKDDVENGESYYIVEIKSLKRILEMQDFENRPVLCFVDEVLRGTNTVERVAAATQILKSLSKGSFLCFAATHDIELTHLLESDYMNCHFEEDIEEGDMLFSYKLKQGRATSKNAIKLLGIMGYEKQIIEQATQMANHFVDKGEWVL